MKYGRCTVRYLNIYLIKYKSSVPETAHDSEEGSSKDAGIFQIFTLIPIVARVSLTESVVIILKILTRK